MPRIFVSLLIILVCFHPCNLLLPRYACSDYQQVWEHNLVNPFSCVPEMSGLEYPQISLVLFVKHFLSLSMSPHFLCWMSLDTVGAFVSWLVLACAVGGWSILGGHPYIVLVSNNLADYGSNFKLHKRMTLGPN